MLRYILGEKYTSEHPDEYIKAESGCIYRNGFHSFTSIEDAKSYLDLLPSWDYVILEVEVSDIVASGIECICQYDGFFKKIPCIVSRNIELIYELHLRSTKEL